MQHLQNYTTLQSGEYRIIKKLGQGGFGITYLAIQRSLNRYIAIKELFLKGINERRGNNVFVSNHINESLFEKQKEKFKKEARRIKLLDSKHIVKVHGMFEENNTAYYVMDFLEGESLASKMKREGHPLTESEVMNILPQLLDALSEIHKYQIWHLDIKPDNIMLIDDNIVLIDFGASKQITPSELTSTALYFTPGYAPAEQTGMLFNQFGPWTDLYAVGATIFNLLTGKSPLEFDIEEFKEDDLPENNLGLMYKMINWMMQPRRKERPQKAVDVKQKYYVDLVSIGVVTISKEVLQKEIVKVKGEDIDLVKDLGATKEQIDKIQKEIKGLFGADIEGYPMTHDCIVVAILQQLDWLFDIGGEESEEDTDEIADDLENLVKEQNQILEERDEETVIREGNKDGNNMTVQEMVALINSDNKKGLETVREIANSGNADAQLLVGIMYQMGVGGENHQSDAAYYFRMAAEQGQAFAQTNLGKCYLAGEGVQQDGKKAFEWFEKAAMQNDAGGQYQLGRCYQHGWGVEKNDIQAFQNYLKAANQDYAEAQINIGLCYYDGIGIFADKKGAFEWFKRAAEQNHPEGQLWVGICYNEGTGTIKNSYEAVKWYRKAAEQGLATAQYNLGINYLKGDGITKNWSEAKIWFQKAADQGNEDAQKAIQYIEQQTNLNVVNSLNHSISASDEDTLVENRNATSNNYVVNGNKSYLQANNNRRYDYSGQTSSSNKSAQTRYKESPKKQSYDVSGFFIFLSILAVGFIVILFVINQAPNGLFTKEETDNKKLVMQDISSTKVEKEDDEFAYDPWSGKYLLEGGMYRNYDSFCHLQLMKSGTNIYSGEIEIYFGLANENGLLETYMGKLTGKVRGKSTKKDLTLILGDYNTDDPYEYIKYGELKKGQQIFRISFNGSSYSFVPIGNMGKYYEGVKENKIEKQY